MNGYTLSLLELKQLTEMEAKHSISSQWKMSDQEFKVSEQARLLDKKRAAVTGYLEGFKKKSFFC